MALKVVDRAMQSFGAEGISQDTPLSYWWAGLRTLRYADVSSFLERQPGQLNSLGDIQGPDEVHIQQIGERELKRAEKLKANSRKTLEKETALFRAYGIKAQL